MKEDDMNIFGKGSRVSINGKTYVGNNININGNQVYIDGELQDDLDDTKKIEVSILSNVEKIVSEESIYIKGNVKGNVEAKASVNCDDITGNVSAGASVNCDNIHGNAFAGATINCDDIKGNATANKINR